MLHLITLFAICAIVSAMIVLMVYNPHHH